MKRWLVISALVLSVTTGSLLLDSCKKETAGFFRNAKQFVTPPGFPQPVYNFSGNPLTDAGFVLGRKLFYDSRLSSDGHVNCGSCHQPVAAFTTFDHDRSHGVNGTHTLRNAPGLFNLAWYPVFNHDGNARHLHEVYQDHMTNPTILGETIPGVLGKLKDDTEYKRMFNNAFGDEKITQERMFKALDQFVVNLVSANSKYDRVKQGKASFNFEEEAGYALFRTKCADCHQEPLFTDFSFRNVGLGIDPILRDYGRMMVTKDPTDSLKFRVPSLRNLEFTSYYMHDGRINLPRNVLKFYQGGINQSTTLDPLLVNGITLTQAEENSLMAFLRTLSDSTFLNDTRFRQ